MGRSEVAFDALFWLAATLRDSGDLTGAETELARALDICERAGLIAQSVEAISARAVVLALAGRDEQARAAAEEAERLAGRLHYPVGRRREGRGRRRLRRGPRRPPDRVEAARERWSELGRPLDAARCTMVLGRVTAESADDAGQVLERGRRRVRDARRAVARRPSARSWSA